MSAGDLTHEQLVIACKNVGVDLECGACAAVFYTGEAPGLSHTCEAHKDAAPLIYPASGPRPYTAEEVRAQVLRHIRMMVHYWENVPTGAEDAVAEGTTVSRYKLDGLAFSILVMLDGGSALPAFDLIPSPHESDRAYHAENGDNWYPDDVVINDTQMHEEWYAIDGKSGLPAQRHAELVAYEEARQRIHRTIELNAVKDDPFVADLKLVSGYVKAKG